MRQLMMSYLIWVYNIHPLVSEFSIKKGDKGDKNADGRVIPL